MRTVIRICLLTMAALTSAAEARADSILYDTLRQRGPGGTLLDGFVVAEDVTLRRASHVTGLSFWLLSTPQVPPTWDLAWLVFEGGDAWPGAEIARGLSPMTLTPISGDATYTIARSDISLDVSLDAGLYWFALHAGSLDLPPISCDYGPGWMGATPTPKSGYVARESQYVGDPCTGHGLEGGAGFWDFTLWGVNDSKGELGLQIRGVPEPASLGLLAIGTLAWMKRRRQLWPAARRGQSPR